MSWKLLRNSLTIVCLLLLSGLVGYRLGTNGVSLSLSSSTSSSKLPGIVVNRDRGIPKDVDFSLFWQVWDEVSTKYVDKSKLDTQKMVYGAISGMVGAIGDPYTVFLPPTQNKEVKGDLNGTFEGIGAELGVKDKRIVVVAPLKDSPSEMAGVKTGDWIIKVDGKETAGWTLPEAVSHIRGDKGSQVVLNLLHQNDSKPIDVKIIRDTIKVVSTEWKVVEASPSAALKGKVAYLRLSRFGDTTNAEWDKSINEITTRMATDSAVKGLVLDLRNNPGGFITSAVYLASEFLPNGVVVEQQDYTGAKQTYSVNRLGKMLQTPLVILINQGSASASEILSGALRVRGRTKLVGMQSFGKGSVQEASDISDGAGLHITIAKWLLPDGSWIQGKGLTPDFKIELDDKDPTVDTQLNKAVDVLLSEVQK